MYSKSATCLINYGKGTDILQSIKTAPTGLTSCFPISHAAFSGCRKEKKQTRYAIIMVIIKNIATFALKYRLFLQIRGITL
ncbi:MAG: hypothetical protein IJ680_00865 [Paludibacteraceae bacterium]|nr:hypothetical protein [Paludibacteraceae bacterium]